MTARLLNRDFLLLFQGKLTSSLGSAFYMVVVIIWLQEQFDSPRLIGLMAMLGALPMVIFGPIGGVFADRHSRKWILVGGDFLAGVTTLAVCLALFLKPENHGLIISLLVFDIVLSSIAMTFFVPAAMALLPELVPPARLPNANGLMQGATELMQMGGQALAGILYVLIGAPWLILVTSVGFLLSAVSESFIREPSRAVESNMETTRPGIIAEMRVGLDAARAVPGFLGVLAMSLAVDLFMAPLIVMLPFYVSDQLLLKPHWLGFLMSALAGGTVLGGLVMGMLRIDGRNRATVFMGLNVFIPVVFLGLAMTQSGPTALACMAMLGIVGAMTGIIGLSAMQTLIAPDRMGRVMALYITLSAASAPLAMGAAGLLVEAFDRRVDLLLIGSGGAILVVTLVALAAGSAQAMLSYGSPADLKS